MDSGKPDVVAVVAPVSDDQLYLQRLLQAADYSVSVFDTNEQLSSAHLTPQAVVVCHRRSSELSTPDLPTCSGHQRVLVFSDCNREQTVVSTLEAGAHHYFPFGESDELVQARLAAALRHHNDESQRVLNVAPFRFNVERRHVYLNNQLINLSPKEYEFAHYLFSNRDRVVVNNELMTSVWSLPTSMDARRIDTAACRVRKKMQLSEAATGWRLRRLRSVGYQLEWFGDTDRNDGLHGTEQVA